MLKTHKGTVTCRICPFQAWTISPHLKMVHNLSNEDYRIQYPEAKISYVWNKGKTAKRNRSVALGHKKRTATMWKKGLFKIAAAKTSAIRHLTNNYPQKYKGLTKEDCPELIEKGHRISTTLKEGYRSGRLLQPNKGKTKETHPEVAKWAASVSATRKRKFASGELKVTDNPNIGVAKGGIRKDLGYYVRSTLEANFL